MAGIGVEFSGFQSVFMICATRLLEQKTPEKTLPLYLSEGFYMSNFDDFAYPDSFTVTKRNGSVLNLRGSVNGEKMYLVTTEDLTLDDVVTRKPSTVSPESYQIKDIQFIEAEAGSPAQQRLTVKRVFKQHLLLRCRRYFCALWCYSPAEILVDNHGVGMKIRYATLLLTIFAGNAQADRVTDALRKVFERSPDMIDNCATKLASGASIDRDSGWPAYCNKFENTDVVQSRVKELRGSSSNFSTADKKSISKGQVRIGMSASAAEAAWGRPKTVNRTTDASGVREQWVYGSGNYLYIRNGYLESIQN